MFVIPMQTTIASPCIGRCRLDATGLCEGCRRSGEEIARWLQLTDAERLHLMNEILPQRAVTDAPV